MTQATPSGDPPPCDLCLWARESSAFQKYTPLCLWCGARAIQTIQKYRIPAAEKVARCRKVLADWMAHGHAEAEIRALSSAPAVAYAPIAKSRVKALAGPKRKGRK